MGFKILCLLLKTCSSKFMLTKVSTYLSVHLVPSASNVYVLCVVCCQVDE